MFLAQGFRSSEELGAGGDHSALTLNGLKKDGDGFGSDGGFQRLEIIEWQVAEAGGQGIKALLDLVLAGRTDATECPAMEGHGKTKDLVPR